MARGYHQTSIIGYLGKDPELRYTTSGDAVGSFTVAVTEQWKDKDGNQQERTEWYNCVVWRKLAEICGEHLKKGSRIFAEGRIRTETWDDRETGVKRYQQKLHIDSLVMLSQPTGQPGQAEVAQSAPTGRIGDDLPF